MKKYSLLIFLFIVISALTLRVYQLSSRPAGFTWDEAALGYNAFSLLQTGKDEYGQTAPIIFKSFGDYKPGLYIYFTIPVIKIFGLNEFATRLPSALFGTLLAISTGLLAVKLFNRRLFLPSLFIVAVSPWAIHFSRGAWEANLALLLTVLGSIYFIKKRFLFAALFFGLTLFAYQGAKLTTPLILLGLLFSFRPKFSLRQVLLPILLLGLFALPILMGWSSQTGRLKVFNVFSYTRSSDVIENIKKFDSETPFLFPLFHAEIIDQGRGIAQRYLNHLSPRFLFIEGDWSNLRQSTPFHGNFYLVDILTLILGLAVLSKARTPGSTFLALWLFVAPIPAAFSRDIISAVRSLPLIVPISIVMGLGLQSLFSRKLLAIAYSCISLFSIVYFFDLYHIHSPNYSAADWLYPYRPAFEIIKENYSAYDKIVFTNKLGQPYIFALFYLGVDPEAYQNQSSLSENSVGDVGEVRQFDKFEFRPVFWPADRSLTSTLVAGGIYELPEQDLVDIKNLGAVHMINYPNGTGALKIAELK